MSGSIPISFNCAFWSSGIFSISEISLAISSGVIFFIAAADAAKVSGFVDSSSMIRRRSSADGVEKRGATRAAIRNVMAPGGAWTWKAWFPVIVIGENTSAARTEEDAATNFMVLERVEEDYWCVLAIVIEVIGSGSGIELIVLP